MKVFIAMIMLVVTGIHANAQCDKKIKWSGAKGEMYNTDGGLLDTKLDSIFFETDGKNITLTFQSDDKSLEGTVTSKVCEWKEPFKNGRSVYNAIVNIDGVDSKATFTLVAKDQKVTLSVEIEERKGRRFLIYFDKYEEIK